MDAKAKNTYAVTYLAKSKRHDLEAGVNSLGRNPTNDFRVSDASVSSFHCEILVSGDVITVRDLDSTNGTFIDDEPVRTERQIHSGQELRLGAARLSLRVATDVAIPRSFGERPSPGTDAGREVCSTYPDKEAQFVCHKCGKYFSADAVRAVGVSGARSLLFGADCRGPCSLVPVGIPLKKKKVTFIGKLTQTIQIFRTGR